MLGLCTVTFREKSPDEIIKLVEESKLEAIEWWGKGHILPGDLETAKRITQKMKEVGLVNSSYGSYYKVGVSEGNFEDIIQTTQALETNTIRIWAGDKGSEDSDEEWFDHIVDSTEIIAKMASNHDIKLAFEYHAGSLTDTDESTEKLMNTIKADNVFLYYQPREYAPIGKRIDSIERLGKWITNIHVFHWEDYDNRFSLEEGREEWLEYIKAIENKSPHSNNYLLEFVKDNSEKQFFKDSNVLHSLFNK